MYVVILTSRAGAGPLFDEVKPRHDTYWRTHVACLRFAGPILADNGERQVGRVLLLDIDDRDSVEKIVANDPLVSAGCFERWSVHQFRLPLGAIDLTKAS